MNSEYYEHIEKQLFNKGALDVYKTPIIMKKGRPAVKLSVLVDYEKVLKIEESLFRLTTTGGLRKYKVDKVMLNRKFEKVNTKYGKVNLKKFYYKGECVSFKPEYSECIQLAKENNCSVKEIYNEINKGKINE